MCGLISVLLAPKKRDPWELDRIWDIFTEALIQNEERGRDATGVGVVQEDGECRIWKLSLPAREFVQTEDYLRRARRVFNVGSVCLLGHTRRPTKGQVGNSRNNHPLLTHNIIGIHNGNIDNDDQLFGDYELPRLGEVDSEAIFALLETIPPSISGAAYQQAVRGRVRRLAGRMTTISLDRRRPGELMVLKRDMPVSMHFNRAFDALFFSSRYVFLRKAFGRSVITEALESKRGYVFDRYRFSKLQSRYSSCFALSRPN